MYKLLVALALVAVASALPAHNVGSLNFRRYPHKLIEQPTILIVGGTPARPHEYPHSISLLYFNSHICGGSILNNNWILTAAHCAEIGGPASYQVRAGVHDRSNSQEDWQTVGVSRIIMHPQYNPSSLINDIALMQLSTALRETETVGHVKMPTQMQPSDGIAWVCGWGSLTEGGSSPNVLQKVDVPIVTDEICRQRYSGVNPVADHMICAGLLDVGGKDACQGDSGGPMHCGPNVDDQYHCGIVSWGVGCARPQYPGVYTETSHFVDWIRDNMN